MIAPGILHNPNADFCASTQNHGICGFCIDIPQILRYARAIKEKTRQANRPERAKTMTRNEAKALQAKHNMEILRNPITSEARALYLEAEQPISELDDLADISRRSNGCAPCYMEANYEVYNATGSGVTYKLSCPTTWFDLWGWVDE